MATATAAAAADAPRPTGEVSRQEIQEAIAKAVELRALHAALLHTNNSPAAAAAHLCLPSPVSRHASQLSAQDYPVFTPL